MELLDSTFKAHKIKMNLICSIDYCWLIISNSTKYGPSSGRMWNNVTNVNVFAYDAQQEYMIPSNNALTNSQKAWDVAIMFWYHAVFLGSSLVPVITGHVFASHWTRCDADMCPRLDMCLYPNESGGRWPLDRSWTRVFISCSNNVLTIPQKTSIVISCESFTNARRQAQ